MMSRFAIAAVVVVTFASAGSARAEPTPSADTAAVVTTPSAVDVARDIRHNGLSLGLYAGFFSPIGVYRDGALIDIGIFGGDAGRYFDDGGQVAMHLRDYRHQKIAGVTLWSTGMAALVADLVLVCVTASNRSIYHDNEALYWSLLGGGFATSMVGAIVLGSANHSLQAAVSTHNADLLNKYLPASERTNVGAQ
jgi:hypothetical protein